MKKIDCVEYEYVRAIDNENSNICLQRHKINIQFCNFVQIANVNYDFVFAFRRFVKAMNNSLNYKH